MPYIMKPEGRFWVIRKKWSGKRVGKTDSKSKALGMIRALYANERKR